MNFASASPLVSVITGVYNTPEEYLRESVASILEQTYVNLELLLVDDCSNSTTNTVLRELASSDPRVKLLVNEENLGLTKSLNKALSQVRGEYIARMDGDDLCAPERLERQVAYLERHREIAILGTEYYELRNGKKTKPRRYPNQPWQIQGRLLFGCQGILHPSVMFRAKIFREDGLRYDERFRIAQDFELWSRAGLQYNLYVLPEYLTTYRISDVQVSVSRRDKQIEYRDKVLFARLTELGIEPTESEKKLHVQFSLGKQASSVADVRAWAQRLLDANARENRYHPVSFEYYVRKREFDSAFHTASRTKFSIGNYRALMSIAFEALKATKEFKQVGAKMQKNYE